MRDIRGRRGPRGPVITAHARTRMSQRAIRLDVMQLAMLFGREVHAANAVFVVVGRREVDDARVDGIDINDLEGIHVVCSRGGDVITVYRDRTLRALGRARRAA
jgi:Domain of unknown function (DUF4258)